MIDPNLSAHLAHLRRNGCSQATLDKTTLLHGVYISLKTQRPEREARWIRRARVVLWGNAILAVVVVLVLTA